MALATLDFATYLQLSREQGKDFLARRVDRTVAFVRQCERSPFVLPWFSSGLPPFFKNVRSNAAARLRRENGELRTWLMFLLWPWCAFALAVMLSLRYRGAARRFEGLSFARLLRLVLAAAFARNVAPTDTFMLRAFREPALYIAPREAFDFHEAVQTPHDDVLTVNDKVGFREHCRAHGLPTPDIVLACGYRGERLRWIDADRLPREDLFCKPIDSFGGQGATRWRYDGATDTWTHGANRCDERRFLNLLGRQAVIVQRCIQPHPALAGLSPNGLSTVRAMTLRDSDGTVRPLAAMMKFALGDSVVDNYWAGGLIAPVDWNVGVLGRGVKRDFAQPSQVTHPETGARLDGARIPLWADLTTMVLRGHRTLPGLTWVGWDVAVTNEGVTIVEANIRPSVELVQVASERGLGQTPFLDWAEVIASTQGDHHDASARV